MIHPHIYIFFQVVEAGSFSKAAALRSCSTVSIMNQINALEDRLGIKLLARSAKGISLTDVGKSFYADARELAARAEQIVSAARSGVGQEFQVIRLGASLLRPCQPLLNHLDKIKELWINKFRIKVVAFNDSAPDFQRFLKHLGEDADCFVGPCDSAWQNKFNILQLGLCKCCISLSVGHPLAVREFLTWDDLAGQKLLLVAKGVSPTLDRLREDICRNHPEIGLLDADNFYDVESFNQCEQGGYLMETTEVWAGIHPGLVTLPVKWDYVLPFGIIYAKNPAPAFREFA